MAIRCGHVDWHMPPAARDSGCLVGLRPIAQRLAAAWRLPRVESFAVGYYAILAADPLPLQRLELAGRRKHTVAFAIEPETLDAWASRQLCGRPEVIAAAARRGPRLDKTDTLRRLRGERPAPPAAAESRPLPSTTTSPVPASDPLEGFKEICEYIQRVARKVKPRTVRQWAARPEDPLPVERFGGKLVRGRFVGPRVVGRRERIDAWLARQRAAEVPVV